MRTIYWRGVKLCTGWVQSALTYMHCVGRGLVCVYDMTNNVSCYQQAWEEKQVEFAMVSVVT